jgi:type IV pilus assembly protein PilQ
MKKIILTYFALLAIGSAVVADPIAPGRQLSLTLEDVPLVAALNMIAAQNELNLVISGDVQGNVTVNLDGVDVGTALDAILIANGYNYFLIDDVIVVKSADVDAAGELEPRLIKLKYMSAITAVTAVTSAMSAKGRVVILDRIGNGENGYSDERYQPTQIVVTDYPNLLDKIEDLVTKIDIPERSLLIEAKIIETTIDAQSNLGINWPSSLSASMTGAVAASGSIDPATAGVAAAADLGSAATYDPNSGDWQWGKLTVGQVDWILNALEQDGNSRLVSDPSITTLENFEAEFRFETIIPILTINRFSEGAAVSDIVTFEDEEIGISLRVLPRINEAGQITMDVESIVEDIIGYTGPIENQRPITASRSIRTRITVADGETVALGGLLKEDEIKRVRRVPLLGRIPLLGKLLFSSTATEKRSTDLLILITPHILK